MDDGGLDVEGEARRGGTGVMGVGIRGFGGNKDIGKCVFDAQAGWGG